VDLEENQALMEKMTVEEQGKAIKDKMT